jgi:uncharacterized membrane protein YebE (DUF533 family)
MDKKTTATTEARAMLAVAAADGVITRPERDMIVAKLLEGGLAADASEADWILRIEAGRLGARVALENEPADRRRAADDARVMLAVAAADGIVTREEQRLLINKLLEAGLVADEEEARQSLGREAARLGARVE